MEAQNENALHFMLIRKVLRSTYTLHGASIDTLTVGEQHGTLPLLVLPAHTWRHVYVCNNKVTHTHTETSDKTRRWLEQ